MAFCAIPAIDITKGSCVRLKQGLIDDSTVYSENPVQVARRWVNEKATRIHLVDLDGAFSGNQENTSLIEQIQGNIFPLKRTKAMHNPPKIKLNTFTVIL